MAKSLPKFIRDTLGLTSDAERSLQFVRSAPGMKTALVGMSSLAHVRANLRIIGEPLATAEQFSGLFVRTGKT